jgi:multiple sugar transport system substrate-binding protein
MKRKALSCLVAVFVLAISSLASVRGTQAQDRTWSSNANLTFWHSFVAATQPALKSLINDFNTTHPGIHVTPQYVPTGDVLLQKLTTAVASHTAPDISWIHNNYIQPLADANGIYNLTPWFKQEPIADQKDVAPALLQQATYKGKLYAMPVEATSMAIFYNIDLFRKAGVPLPTNNWTWDEFARDAQRLTNPARKQWGFFVPDFVGALEGYETWQFMPWAWEAGGDYATPNGKRILWDSKGFVRAVQFWHDLIWKYHAATTNPPPNAFFSGKLAMYYDGNWDLPTFFKLPFHWGVAFLPRGPVTQSAPIGGEYLAIFKQSLHPQQTWEFVKWWTSPQQQAIWSSTSGYLPMRISTIHQPAFQKYARTHPGVATFAAEISIGRAPGVINNFGQVDPLLANALQKVFLTKNANVQAIMTQAAHQATIYANQKP